MYGVGEQYSSLVGTRLVLPGNIADLEHTGTSSRPWAKLNFQCAPAEQDIDPAERNHLSQKGPGSKMRHQFLDQDVKVDRDPLVSVMDQ